MARSRYRKSNSPARKQSPGLFVMLIIAIGLGVFVGSCAGRHSSSPSSGVQPTPRTESGTRSGMRAGRIEPEHQQKQAEDQLQQKPETKNTETAKAEPSETQGTPNGEAANTEQPIQNAPGNATNSPSALPSTATQHHTRRPGGYPGEISHVSGAERKIALTFDAGASPAPTPAILRALKAAGIHVTFFLTGKWCEQNPGLVRDIVDQGHEIGNHTYSHKDLRKLSTAEVVDQLSKMENIAVHLTGRSTKPYFRAPFGARDKRVMSIAAQEGYTSVYWAVDSWDAFKKGITSSEIKSRVLGKVDGGDIVLLHCGSQPTADALPDLINDLQSRGYQIVRVSDLAH